MSTEFEFFQGSLTESTTAARITVRRGGHLVLTQAAVEMLGEDVGHVQIGYSPETQAVGIRAASEETRGSYRLRSQKNSPSHIVDGKRFFRHHDLQVEKAQTFDAETFPGGIVGFRLAEKPEPPEAEDTSAEPSPKPARSRRKVKAAS